MRRLLGTLLPLPLVVAACGDDDDAAAPESSEAPGAEVPGPGQAEGAGRFEAELVDGVLCVAMDVAGLPAGVTGAHVHDGAAGSAGPVLVDVGAPGRSIGGEARWRDACSGVSDAVIERLAGAPDQHDANVHTAGFPDGAVRGQLAVASVSDRTLE